jgi:HD-GYP domain-containing protein (c-di-GMP phosphodiesterase class II)
MHEVLEGHEGDGGHEEGPFTIPVSVTLSILAVLVAIATLFGHRSAKEELLLQTQEADQWAFFQAKNSGLHGMQTGADMLGTFTTVDKEKAEQLREKYLKEAARYSTEKAEAQEKAEDLQKERAVIVQRGDRYEVSEVLLEIALILTSFTLITKKKFFWFAGSLLGLAGFAVALSGFLLH